MADVKQAPRRVLVFGATGSAGGAVARALASEGHEVVCFLRPAYAPGGELETSSRLSRLEAAELRFGEVEPASLARDAFRGEAFDAVISCLASRTGAPKDAWAVDHRANLAVLEAAKSAGAPHMVLLSAICVQKPKLAFQHAKLAFEAALTTSGLRWSIVRPTAFFKSLSGQIERVRAGKPFLVFGDGALTACKPIGDEDLGAYIAGCLDDPARWNAILPIGGPGPAISPREQGERLFALLGRPPKLQRVPLGVLDAVIAVLSALGRVSPKLAEKAELARIGRYYATESMLVWNAAAGRYDADATPETGAQTLFDVYADVIAGAGIPDRGDHAVFKEQR